MNIQGKTVTELKELLKKKVVSDDELFSYFTDRSLKHNKNLNAYVTMNKVANQSVGKLHGIPLAIKDNFCTKGLRTTASSKVLVQFIPPYESTVTAKLKDNGASVIGKTNMDAWAHGSSTETSDYGPTCNPWNTEYVAGGSSGGSAAAVSAYLAPAAIGSETAGSIRGPAAWCGVVGLKPTYGRVSRYGVVAMGSSFDSPGPITLSVEDAALLLSIIAGKDRYDATTSPVKVDDYVSDMKMGRKMKIGIPEEYFNVSSDHVKKTVLESIELFEKMGHTIKKVSLMDPKYTMSVYTVIQRAEVSSNLARYTGVRYGNDRSYFGEEAKKRIMLGTYTLSYGYYDAFYKKAQKVRTLIINNFKEVLSEVDVLVAPSMPSAALKLGESSKYAFFGEAADVLTEPSAIAGLPAISVPAGLSAENLPIGMQIIGNYFCESAVLNLAYQFEQETDFFGIIKKGVQNYG